MLKELRSKLSAKAQERIVKAQQRAAQHWREERDHQEKRLHLVREFTGNTDTDIFLSLGEKEFYRAASWALIEYLRSPGHFRGRHYIQGVLRPTVVDRGVLQATNRRVVFRGSRKTRECAFADLIAINWDAKYVFLSMSNRQNRVIFSNGWPPTNFLFYLELAIAHYKGSVATLADKHQSLLKQIDARRPAGISDRAQAQSLELPGEPLGREERERALAYREYCIAWAQWEKADPYLRGPEPQWVSQDSDLDD